MSLKTVLYLFLAFCVVITIMVIAKYALFLAITIPCIAVIWGAYKVIKFFGREDEKEK